MQPATLLKRLAILCLATLVSACGGGSDASFDNGNARLLVAVEVSPAQASIAAGEQQRFTATGVYSDGSREDVSTLSSWASGDTAIASVDEQGLATGLAAGTANISASVASATGPVSGSGTLEVTAPPPRLTSVEVFPPAVTMPLGTTQDFRAIAFFDDGSRENVTFAGNWSLTEDPPILARYETPVGAVPSAIDDFGTAISIALGVDELRFEFQDRSASSAIEVVAAELVSITISPRDESVPVGALTDFTASGIFTDGSTENLTAAVEWSSSDPGVAVVSNASPTRGQAEALAVGVTTISAVFGDIGDATQLRVSSDPVQRIDVLPANQTINIGGSQQYQALAVLASGEVDDVTAAADWDVSNQAVATISAGGLAVGVGEGAASVSAIFEGLSGSAELEVETPVSLVEVVVSPPTQTLFPTQAQAYTATAVYSDGSTTDVTRLVIWSSSDPNVARVSNGEDFGFGLAIALLPGDTQIIATLQQRGGSLSGAADLTVLPPTSVITKLEVNPPLATIVAGETQQYEAIGVLQGGGRVDVSNFVTWRSADTAIANIAGAGLAYGESAGTTAISAQLPGTSIIGEATLNVEQALTVEAVVVSPPTAQVLAGDSQAYTAVALLSNGTQVDVTDDVDWATADSTIAVIAPGGLAEGVAQGTTTVIATLDVKGLLIQGSASITVLPLVTVEEVIVSPPAATLLVGSIQQYTAEVRLSDGRVVDVTEYATWVSSDTSIAQINGTGVATALTPGQTTIRASITVEGIDYTGDAQLTVEQLVVERITISPQQDSTLVGSSRQFTATAVLSDGSTRDITAEANWFVTDTGVAAIQSGSNAGLATGLSAGSTGVYVEYLDNTVLVPCEGVPACQAELTVEEPGVLELAVTPATADIIVTESRQYTATAILENGDRIDVSSQVSWRSSDISIASVDPLGLATGLAPGEVQISAELDDGGERVSGEAILSVQAPPVTVEDIRVTPEQETILLGDTLQYTATALLSDGSAADVTGLSAWSSSNAAIGFIDGSGLATGVAAGTVVITADFNLNGTVYSGTTTLTVEEPLTITGIQVTPTTGTLLAGDSLQYTATATLSDATTRDITRQSAWFTSDGLVATVEQGANAGLATGQSTGEVAVWVEFTFEGATYPCEGLDSCQATLRVVEPVTALRIDVKPQRASVLVGDTQQYQADLVLSDNTVIDITESAGWRAADSTVARLQAPGGLFVGLAEGSTAVIASGSYEGSTLEGSASLQVEPPAVVVERLEVVPAVANVFVGDSGSFRAIAYLSNGEVLDVSLESIWRSSNPEAGVIDPATGFAVALSAGNTDISASFSYEGDVATGTSQVTITEAQPDLLAVFPTAASIAAGDTQQFTATLYYEDGREEPVTDDVAWQSSDTSVATISGAAGSEGLASGLSQGTVSIRATHGSGLSASAELQVLEPALVSLVIDPASTDVIEGEEQRLFALASFSDESVLDVSSDADWSSSNNSVASVDNSAADGGVVSGIRAGSATVTAAYRGLAATSAITVAANSLVGGWIEPASYTLDIGAEQDYRAFGEFLDGSNREITQEVVWQTSAPAVATVGNGGGQPPGRVLALAEGATEISATFEGSFVDASPLTVTGPEAVTLELTPSAATLLQGGTARFIANVVLSDNSTRNVTDLSIWSTGNANVAVVDNPPNDAGKVTATGPGSTVVTARYQGLSASAPITVSEQVCQGRPTSIIIDSGDQIVPEGQTVQFTARGIYADGCNQDITESNQTVWQSQGKKICDFNSPKGGEATGLREGVATVRASHRGRTDEATCTVTPRED